MRSRYSAYALSLCDYSIKTTHPDNPDYSNQTEEWRMSLLDFTHNTQFLGLTIIEFIDGDTEAFVTFCATLSSGELVEKSRFLKVEGQWLYESGKFN
jgi:SEC-C motif-containing protein